MPNQMSVDDYIAALPDDRRATMAELRETIVKATVEKGEYPVEQI